MFINRWYIFATTLAALLSSLSVKSQQTDSVAVITHKISNVTVVGNISSANTLSAVPFQTLSAEQISALGITDMADAVRRFAGVSVKDYGGIGGLKTVSVRNMGAAHTAVSYDGVAVGNTQAGQIDIGRFPLDNVAMMSLVVGQSDNLLQAARLFASAGVLNITTIRPEFNAGRSNSVNVKLETGSFGLADASVRIAQRVGENTSVSADATLLRADGNYPFRLHNGTNVTDERRNNSAIASHRLEAGLYHNFSGGGTLDIKGLYYYSRRGLPGAVIYYNPKATERLWDQDAFLQASFRKSLSDKWRIQAQAKYAHGWTRHKGTGIEYVDGYFRDVMRQNEYYLSATALFSPTRCFAVSLAQDGIINTLSTSFPECQYPRRLTSITALNARLQFGETVRINAGGVYMATDEHVRYGTPTDDFHRFAPSASLRLKPFSGQQLYLRLMAKSTFRLPTFNDMYYYRIGNTRLRPEKAKEFNAGITFAPEFNNTGWFEAASLSVDGYFNRVTDKIVAIPTTFAWKMQNFGKVHASGIDISLQAAFKPTTWLDVTIQGAYTWQKALDMTDKKSKTYKHQLPYTPRNNGNAALTVKMPWITVGYSVVCVGRRYFMAQNLPENEIAAYNDHTLSLQRSFTLPRNSSLNIKADIINLTDEQYDVIKYYPMPGRNWRLSATYSF